MTRLTTRNASLEDLANLLKGQHARKLDVVAPAATVKMVNGSLVIAGAEPVLDEDGVTSASGVYWPTSVCDEGIADKLGVPLPYVRRLRKDRVDLLDDNVNGWLHGRREKGGWKDGEYRKIRDAVPPDERKFLIRCFRGDDGSVGVARAFLSDQYRVIDNLDVLMAALEGVKQAGVRVDIDGCDLSERRMYVRLVAPEVTAMAATLLADYRSPFRDPALDEARAHDQHGSYDFGYGPVDDPIVSAGLQITNSETGGGAFTISPRLLVKICKNGMIIGKDALRNVHLGGKLDAGVVRWSDDTQQKNLDLVKAKTADAVASFLDRSYVEGVVAGIEQSADVRVASTAVETLGKRLQYSEATIAGVLDHFVRGGSMTAGGVMNAVTSYAQTVPDPDAANELEGSALRVLELAAAGG